MRKNIMITGASSGIGEAVAKYLAQSGEYSLLLIARNVEKLQTLANDLGDHVSFLGCDLQQTDNIGKVFEYCKKNSFVLNGLVYCAGIAGNYPIRSLSQEFLLKMMQINCLSFIEMAKFAINRKFSMEECSIVAISSLSSLTVNAVMPGYVQTPMMGDTAEADIVDEQPWGYIDPEEIAALIEFLLSDKSKKITGANIPISAGMAF